jgi:hypothetical protein
MHVYVFSDGELLALIGLVAAVAWFASRFWTMRAVRKNAGQDVNSSASLLEPIETENRQLRALVEQQESRLRSLETIATDPAERTAREIESLRHA